MKPRLARLPRAALTGFLAVAAVAVCAQLDDPPADIKVKVVPVAGPIHMIEGGGGNIGLSVGGDGVLMVDSLFESLAAQVKTAIRDMGAGDPKLLLNTHFHSDHVGGNPFFADAGVVLAHANVRTRMLSCDPGAVECATEPMAGLPIVTFRDRLRLFFNGDEIDVIHLPGGHTDGDLVVWFKNSKVIHMGDLLFHSRFPFVDMGAGGSVDDLLANLERLLDMLPPDTRVIAGHGPLGGVEGIRDAADMIRASLASVAAAADADALAALKRDGIEGYADWSWGFVNTARWVDTIVASKAARTTTR